MVASNITIIKTVFLFSFLCRPHCFNNPFIFSFSFHLDFLMCVKSQVCGKNGSVLLPVRTGLLVITPTYAVNILKNLVSKWSSQGGGLYFRDMLFLQYSTMCPGHLKVVILNLKIHCCLQLILMRETLVSASFSSFFISFTKWFMSKKSFIANSLLSHI